MSTIEHPGVMRFPRNLVLDSLADGILATDADVDGPHGPSIVYVNRAFSEISGYDRDELIGRSPRVLQGADTDRALMRRLSEDLRAGRPFTGQTINYRKDGTPFEMEWSIAAVPGEDGSPEWFVAVQRDATLPSRRLLEAERTARLDALTGLPNRRHVDDVLAGGGWLGSRARSALVIDLDHFKAVNDTYGHLVGDEVLQEVGQRLQASVREGELVARWGGEEFCVLTLHGGSDVTALAERIRAAIAHAPIQTEAGPVPITASVGCAALNPDHADAQGLLRAADGALYEAKRTGRNRVHVA